MVTPRTEGARRMGKDDVIVNRYRLDEITRKAKAHDAYLWATKRMADRHREVVGGRTRHPFQSDAYIVGYSDALMDFSELVQQAPLTTE